MRAAAPRAQRLSEKVYGRHANERVELLRAALRSPLCQPSMLPSGPDFTFHPATNPRRPLTCPEAPPARCAAVLPCGPSCPGLHACSTSLAWHPVLAGNLCLGSSRPVQCAVKVHLPGSTPGRRLPAQVPTLAESSSPVLDLAQLHTSGLELQRWSEEGAATKAERTDEGCCAQAAESQLGAEDGHFGICPHGGGHQCGAACGWVHSQGAC